MQAAHVHGISNIISHSRTASDFPGICKYARFKVLGAVNECFVNKEFHIPSEEIIHTRLVGQSGRPMHYITTADPSVAKWYIQIFTYKKSEMGEASIMLVPQMSCSGNICVIL